MTNNSGFRIKTLHAYTAIGDDNEEGIIGGVINGMLTPFIGADEVRIKELRQAAIETGKATGKKVKLVCFSVREDIEDLV